MPCKAPVACAVLLSFVLATWPMSVSGEEAADTSTTQAVTAELTIEEALRRTLDGNPTLAGLTHEIEARSFEIAQAGKLPNPELSLEVENVAGSGAFSGTDRAETTLRLSQRFETAGKRKRRQELAHGDRILAEQEFAVARAQVLAEARSLYISVLAAQEKLALADEQATLAARVLETVEERIAAGKTPAIERLRFRTEVAEARLRRGKAVQELTAARRALAAVWGSDRVDFAAVRGDLKQLPPLPPWTELQAEIEHSPEALLQDRLSRRADSAVALEAARQVPDLTFSLGARDDRDTGDQALVAEVSVPLSIFDRNRDAVAAARVRREIAREDARARQLQLGVDLAGLRQKAQAGQDELAVLNSAILPAARDGFDAVLYGYQAGKFGILEVLDAQRVLFAAKLQHIDTLASYHRTLVELERLLGRRIVADAATAYPLIEEVPHE